MNARAVTLILISSLLVLANPPLSADAQETQRIHRVGVLNFGSPARNVVNAPLNSRLVERFAELGFHQGKNLVFEYRWAEGDFDRVQPMVTELMQAKVDVIVTIGNKMAQVVTTANPRIPTVSLSCDPFSTITKYAKPNGNFTGVTCMTTELSPKRLELVKQLVPRAKRVVYLHNPSQGAVGLELTQNAARKLGLAVHAVEVRSSGDLELALAAVAAARPDVLLVYPDGAVTALNRKEIADFALARRLPSIFAYRSFVEAGGLVSYGSTLDELSDRAAVLASKILRGAKPHELPIEQATRVFLTINMKTAKAIGLTMPQSLLIRADEVLQ